MPKAEKPKRIGPLDDAKSVRRELGKIYREARRGTIDTRELTRFVTALRELKGCLISETFEDRIAAVEDAAAKRDAEPQGPGYGR